MNQEEAKALFQQAVNSYERWNFAEALGIYERLSAVFPRHSDVIHEQIRCLIELDRFQKARELAHFLKEELADSRAIDLIAQIDDIAGPANTIDLKSSYAKRMILDIFQLITEIRAGRLASIVGAAVLILFGIYFYFVAFPNMYRTLPFSKLDSIGSLELRDPNSDDPTWKPWKEAQGTLYARRTMQIRLNVKKDSGDGDYVYLQMDALEEFEPDTFWEIDASDSALGDDGLRLISSFNTIRRLNLRNANISGSGLVGFQPDTPIESLDLSDNPFEGEWLPWVGQFGTLKNLNIHNTSVSDAALEHLRNQTNLRSLVLPNDIGDDGLKHLQGLIRLKKLDLSRRKITDRGLSFVGGLTSLEHLDVSATPITDDGVEFLAPLENLLSLNLSDTRVGNAALASVGSFVQLESLDLSGTQVTNAGLNFLTRLERLGKLNLSNHHTLSRISDEGLIPLSTLPLLRELDLSGTHVTAAGVEKLVNPMLTQISLNNTDLSVQNVTELASVLPGPKISHIPLSGNVITFDAADSLGMLWIRPEDQTDTRRWIPYLSARGDVRLADDTHIHLHLSLEGVETLSAVVQSLGAERIRGITFPRGYDLIENLDLESFDSLENIEEIHVPEGELSAALVARLNGKNSLTRLDLGSATISGSDFELLTDLPALEILDLGSIPLGQSSWRAISRFPQLSQLVFHGTSVEAPPTDTMSELRNIRMMDLRTSTIPEASVALLRENLPDTEILHYARGTLPLSFPESNSIGQLWTRPFDGPGKVPWKKIGEARGSVSVPVNSQLRLDVTADALATTDGFSDIPTDAFHTLHLVSQNVTDVTLARIAQFDSLEVLDLFGSSVSDSGLAILLGGDSAESVNPLPNLHTLILASTSITDVSAAALAKMGSLRRVDLARTALTDASVVSLLDLSSLEYLFVEGTKITRTGHARLAAAMPDADLTYQVVTGPAEESNVAPAVRVVHVTSDAPVGTLYVRNWKSNDEDDWKFLAPLYRDVPIPVGQAVKLVLSENDSLAADTLESLSPDVLHTVVFQQDTRIRPSTLSGLASQKSLETLVLDGTVVEAGALSPLADLRRLRTLSLNRAIFDSDELRFLRNVPWLQQLNISGTAVSDDSLIHLASVQSLNRLESHSNQQVADLGVEYLTDHPSITRLNIRGSQATDKSIDRISENEQLLGVDLHGTLITPPRIAEFNAQQDRVAVQYEKRNLDRYEIADFRPYVQRRIQQESSFNRVDLPEILGVATLADFARETLQSVQQLSMEALQNKGAPITSEILTSLSGSPSLQDADPEVRAPLQKMAFNALARSGSRIQYEHLSEVAGVDDFDDVVGEERLNIQSMALSALNETGTGIVRGDLPEMENQTRFEDIPEESAPRLQAAALQAMAKSETGIRNNDLAIIAGVNSYSSVTGEYKTEIQDLALQAMADSDTGIRTENIVMLENAPAFEAIDTANLVSIQRRAMNLIVQSERGVTSGDITELGGADHYEDLPLDSMQSLQQLALSTMVDNNVLVTSENLSQVGGRDHFENLPEERLDNLQVYALSSMSNSQTGITSNSMTELSGLNDFNEFTDDVLEPLQVKALTAMADSFTGITTDSLATVLGADDISYVSDARLTSVRERAITAMAQSTSGIQPGQLEVILGNSVLEVLNLSNSDVVDADLLNIADLTHLRKLDLTGCTNITDNAISYVADAVNLEQIRLAGTPITRAALSSMWNMQSLRLLDVADTSISDDALSNLAFFPALETLHLEGTQVEGIGLSYINKLPELTTLNVARTQVNDQGLAYLPSNIPLTRLDLSQTEVGDRSMGLVGSYTGMEELDLAECANVSDEGFDQLRGLSGLIRLSMYGTNVSDNHVNNLARLSSLKTLYVDRATFDSSSLDTLRRSLPFCRVQGVASLIPSAQLDIVASSSLVARIYDTSGKVIFTTLLVWASFLMTIVPFAPMYMRYIIGFQEYQGAGKMLQAAMTGAYVSGVVVNRSGRAMMYATRWFIIFGVAGIVILIFLQFGIFIFDNYFVLEPDR